MSGWVIDWDGSGFGGSYAISKEITLQNYFASLLIPHFNQIRKIDENFNSDFHFSGTSPFGIRIACDWRVISPRQMGL